MDFEKEFEKYAIKHKGISSNLLNDYSKKNSSLAHANPYLVTGLTPTTALAGPSCRS